MLRAKQNQLDSDELAYLTARARFSALLPRSETQKDVYSFPNHAEVSLSMLTTSARHLLNVVSNEDNQNVTMALRAEILTKAADMYTAIKAGKKPSSDLYDVIAKNHEGVFSKSKVIYGALMVFAGVAIIASAAIFGMLTYDLGLPFTLGLVVQGLKYIGIGTDLVSRGRTHGVAKALNNFGESAKKVVSQLGIFNRRYENTLSFDSLHAAYSPVVAISI